MKSYPFPLIDYVIVNCQYHPYLNSVSLWPLPYLSPCLLPILNRLLRSSISGNRQQGTAGKKGEATPEE
jgi:hypothetical protein